MYKKRPQCEMVRLHHLTVSPSLSLFFSRFRWKNWFYFQSQKCYEDPTSVLTSRHHFRKTLLCYARSVVVYWYLSIQVLSFSFLQGISGVSRSQVNSYTLPEKSHPHRVTCFQIYYIGHGTFNSSLYVKNALKLEMLVIVFIVCLS